MLTVIDVQEMRANVVGAENAEGSSFCRKAGSLHPQFVEYIGHSTRDVIGSYM